MPKMNANVYVIEDYENEPPSGQKKQTQTKPISKAHKPIKGAGKKRVLGTFSGFQLPERI